MSYPGLISSQYNARPNTAQLPTATPVAPIVPGTNIAPEIYNNAIAALAMLPPNCEARQDRTGRIYFVNHNTRSTSWDDPRPFPPGWEEKFDDRLRRKYYVDHNTRSTSWSDPRPPLIPVGLSKLPLTPATSAMATQYATQHRIPLPQHIPSMTNPSALPPGVAVQPVPYPINGSSTNISSTPPTTSHLQTQLQSLNLSDTSKPSSSSSSSILPFPGAPSKTLTGNGTEAADHDIAWYKEVLQMSLADRTLTPEEDRLLALVREKFNITPLQHRKVLEELGWSEEEFNNIKKDDPWMRECVVCLDAAAMYIILDCFHLCLCEDCANLINNEAKNKPQHCPKCRAEIKSIHKTY
jgi:hypothetical protein